MTKDTSREAAVSALQAADLAMEATGSVDDGLDAIHRNLGLTEGSGT